MAKDKRYSIVLRGRVQDVGFRSRIISAAKIYSLRGYPPVNDIDGSVKMICEGPKEQVERFLKDIDIRAELPSGIRVEELEKREIPTDFPLPVVLAPAEAEELSNISGKLDVGIESLKGIEGTLRENTDTLKDMNGTLKDMNETLPKRIADSMKGVFK